MKCLSCEQGSVRHRAIPIVTEVGGHTVKDESLRGLICDACGSYTLEAEQMQKAELRAAITFLRDLKSINGEILRFARKALGLTQAELGKRLHREPETISRWENNARPMEDWVQLSMAALVTERLLPPQEDISLAS